MSKKINVHIYPAPFKNQSRMLKITKSLADARLFDQIAIVGTWEDGLPEIEHLDGARTVFHMKTAAFAFGGLAGKMLKFLSLYWRILFLLWNRPITCINCHSLSILPLAVLLKIRHKSVLIYDTHELETETLMSSGIRKRLARLVEAALIGKADAVSVVSESIAAWYRQSYSLDKVWVVRNVPYRAGDAPQASGLLREELGIPGADLVFIYQGLLGKGRGIELLIKVFTEVPADRHLVLLGYGPLVALAEKFAGEYPNIHFHPAVPPAELPRYTVGADVGLSLIENLCLSYYYSLPNKVFEYITAGVPVIGSDFPEMAALIGYVFGWNVPPEEAAVAALIKGLDRGAIKKAQGSTLENRRQFGWEFEEENLLQMYRQHGFASGGTGKAG